MCPKVCVQERLVELAGFFVSIGLVHPLEMTTRNIVSLAIACACERSGVENLRYTRSFKEDLRRFRRKSSSVPARPDIYPDDPKQFRASYPAFDALAYFNESPAISPITNEHLNNIRNSMCMRSSKKNAEPCGPDRRSKSSPGRVMNAIFNRGTAFETRGGQDLGKTMNCLFGVTSSSSVMSRKLHSTSNDKTCHQLVSAI